MEEGTVRWKVAQLLSVLLSAQNCPQLKWCSTHPQGTPKQAGAGPFPVLLPHTEYVVLTVLACVYACLYLNRSAGKLD